MGMTRGVDAVFALSVLSMVWGLSMLVAYGRLRARWDTRSQFGMRVALIAMVIGAFGVLFALGALYVWALKGAP